jgi:putative ABC transport system substrate-binding protein
MKRRAFLGLLGGATAALPLVAAAQQGARVRRIGMLLPAAPDDPIYRERVWAFLHALAQAGWTVSRDLLIDTRWATDDAAEIRRHAADLAALAPDVILAQGVPTLGSLLQATRTVPIVFVTVADPVGAGFVGSLARPGGNATGIMSFAYDLSGKWPDLLKQLAPGLTRVGVLQDLAVASGTSQLTAIEDAARTLGLAATALGMRDAGEIERGIAAFAGAANGGLIVTASLPAVLHRDLIIALAARYRLPTIYYERFFVAAGGLISYGPDYNDEYRRAAGYVDRILKGEKPADLPVQAPVNYKLAINLKTAHALGLDPRWRIVLARADEVIE